MNMFGDIFPTLHVAVVIMHGVLVIIVFYRFPKRTFYPDSKTILLHLNQENSPISETEPSFLSSDSAKKL